MRSCFREARVVRRGFPCECWTQIWFDLTESPSRIGRIRNIMPGRKSLRVWSGGRLKVARTASCPRMPSQLHLLLISAHPQTMAILPLKWLATLTWRKLGRVRNPFLSEARRTSTDHVQGCSAPTAAKCARTCAGLLHSKLKPLRDKCIGKPGRLWRPFGLLYGDGRHPCTRNPSRRIRLRPSCSTALGADRTATTVIPLEMKS